jgi:hypothetical protein
MILLFTTTHLGRYEGGEGDLLEQDGVLGGVAVFPHLGVGFNDIVGFGEI